MWELLIRACFFFIYLFLTSFFCRKAVTPQCSLGIHPFEPLNQLTYFHEMWLGDHPSATVF
jgi:hypothetical protein